MLQQKRLPHNAAMLACCNSCSRFIQQRGTVAYMKNGRGIRYNSYSARIVMYFAYNVKQHRDAEAALCANSSALGSKRPIVLPDKTNSVHIARSAFSVYNRIIEERYL